jgi:Uncharacterized conserved protein (COG2071)
VAQQCWWASRELTDSTGPVGNSTTKPSPTPTSGRGLRYSGPGGSGRPLHRPFAPADAPALLPTGLQVNTYDGLAWVSLTPFLMARVRPAGMPIQPGISTFPETNLRTYVREHDGRDGIWFLSVEVDSAAMLAARCAVGAASTPGSAAAIGSAHRNGYELCAFGHPEAYGHSPWPVGTCRRRMRRSSQR